MYIEYREHCSDYSGAVIDISYSNEVEAFELGILFQELKEKNLCIWRNYKSIRIPLMAMTSIGLAILDDKNILQGEKNAVS